MRFGGHPYRKCESILLENGWVKEKGSKGSHIKFRKENALIVITKRSDGVNRMMWKRLCKENNITEHNK